MPPLKFTQNKNVSKNSSSTILPYPEATVVYSTSVAIGDPTYVTLPKDVLLYTTDSRELFIGAGSNQGLVKVAGSGSSAVLSVSDYMKRNELETKYAPLDDYTSTAAQVDDNTEAIVSIQGSLSSIEYRLNGTVLDADISSKAVIAVTSSDQYRQDLSNKVSAAITGDNSNTSTIGNSAKGLVLKYVQQCTGAPKFSEICVKAGIIELKVYKNTTPTSGSKLVIQDDGIYYTNDLEKRLRKEVHLLATSKEIADLQKLYHDLFKSVTDCNSTMTKGVDKIREYQGLLTGFKNDISSLESSLRTADSIASNAYTLAQTNNSLCTEISNALESLQTDLGTVSVIADDAQAVSRYCQNAINGLSAYVEGQMIKIRIAIESLQNVQVVYDITNNTNALRVIGIRQGKYICNRNNTYEVSYGTSLYALRQIIKIDTDLNSVEVNTLDPSDTKDTSFMKVEWDLRSYDRYAYTYAVQFEGTLQETENLRLDPNSGTSIVPFIRIKVKPPESIIDKEVGMDGWVLYFIMPANTDVFPNFIEAVQEAAGTNPTGFNRGAQFMGYTVDETQPAQREIYIDIVGAIDDEKYLEDLETTGPVIKTFEELDEIPALFDVGFIRKYAEGLPVPLSFSAGGYSDDPTIYETKCETWGAFHSNGAVRLEDYKACTVYPEGVIPVDTIAGSESDIEDLNNALIFEYKSIKSLVYRVYKPGTSLTSNG